MRGDSLRDLYAKTMAVIGLGLLAGAGAVVDYWPVGNTLPALKAAAVPRSPVPVLVQNLNQVIPSPVVAPRLVARAPIRPANVGSAVFLQASFPIVPATLTELNVAPEPPPVPAWDLVPVDAMFPEALTDSLISVVLLTAGPAPPQPAPASTGFIGGALKKTKDSILRTGAVTGASIADAFRGVVSAFKKVSPFWNIAAAQPETH